MPDQPMQDVQAGQAAANQQPIVQQADQPPAADFPDELLSSRYAELICGQYRTAAQPRTFPMTAINNYTKELVENLKQLPSGYRDVVEQLSMHRAKLSGTLDTAAEAFAKLKAFKDGGVSLPPFIDQGVKISIADFPGKDQLLADIKKAILDIHINMRSEKCVEIVTQLAEFQHTAYNKLKALHQRISKDLFAFPTEENMLKHWLFRALYYLAYEKRSKFVVRQMADAEAKRKKIAAAEAAKAKKEAEEDDAVTLQQLKAELKQLKTALNSKPAPKKPSPGNAAASGNTKKRRDAKRKQPGSRPAKH